MTTKEQITKKYMRLLDLEQTLTEFRDEYTRLIDSMLQADDGPCPDEYNKKRKEYGELIAEVITQLSQVENKSDPDCVSFIDHLRSSRDHFVEKVETMDVLPELACIATEMQDPDAFKTEELPYLDDLTQPNFDWGFDFAHLIASNIESSSFSSIQQDDERQFFFMPPSFNNVHICEAAQNATELSDCGSFTNTLVTIKVKITCQSRQQITHVPNMTTKMQNARTS